MEESLHSAYVTMLLLDHCSMIVKLHPEFDYAVDIQLIVHEIDGIVRCSRDD